MKIRVVVSKSGKNGERVRLSITALEREVGAFATMLSQNDAYILLRRLGVPGNALDLYFSQLFPVMLPDQELAFPIIDVARTTIAHCGLYFKRAS